MRGPAAERRQATHGLQPGLSGPRIAQLHGGGQRVSPTTAQPHLAVQLEAAGLRPPAHLPPDVIRVHGLPPREAHSREAGEVARGEEAGHSLNTLRVTAPRDQRVTARDTCHGMETEASSVMIREMSCLVPLTLYVCYLLFSLQLILDYTNIIRLAAELSSAKKA